MAKHEFSGQVCRQKFGGIECIVKIKRLKHTAKGKDIIVQDKSHIQESELYVTVKRGDIYYADLSPVVGSEQGGLRPVLIVQNDTGNRFSPTVIAAAITSQSTKTSLPTHIRVTAACGGLAKDSIVLLEQIRTIDKKRLKERMGKLSTNMMNQVDKALSVSVGLEIT